MQPHADVPFKVSGLDPAVFEAWTRTGLRDGTRTIDVMHPDRLVNLRSLVRKKPLISIDDLIKEGKILDTIEKRTMAPETVGSREAKYGANQTREMAREVQGTIEVLKKHIEQMDVSDDEELEGHENQDRVNQVTSTEEAAVCMTRSSPLLGVKVGPSLSTKLNYILSEVCLYTCTDDHGSQIVRLQVQRYSVKEKFLIFSNSLLTLFQIGEALSLIEIKYLRYTNQEQYLLREQSIMTFETSDVYRVLLVSLKLGARGLSVLAMNARLQGLISSVGT